MFKNIKASRSPPHKRKKRVEFSKIIIISVSALTLAITIFSCALMWHTADTSPLAYLIPSIFGELATATGFYYKKAEKENTKGGITYDTAMKNSETPPVDMPAAE